MTDIDSLQTELEQTKLLYEQTLYLRDFQAGFLGRIAHEIRSPLTSIMGMHQLIINDLCDNPQEEKEFIQQAYQYGKKLMAMIDQLVEVSKLEVGKIQLQPKEFNLWSLLEDIQQIMDLEAQNRNLKLQLINNAHQNCLIVSDKTRLTNILFYLIEAVIDRSDIGTITLSLEEQSLNQEKIIKFTFPTSELSLNELSETEKKLDLHKSVNSSDNYPQFSVPMKIDFAQTLLRIMQGKLELPNNSPENQDDFRELLIHLPASLDV